MKIFGMEFPNEAFARYILCLQESMILERGEDLYDIRYREYIEAHFPKIKEDRINYEFEAWVLEEKVFKDKWLIKAQTKMSETNKTGTGKIRENAIRKFFERRERLEKKFMEDPNTRKEFNTLRAIKKMQS